MKSKEALNFIRCSGIDKNLIIPIEKDLDMLEILKSHAKLVELNTVPMGRPKTIIIAIDPKDDDYETVKKEIENE